MSAHRDPGRPASRAAMQQREDAVVARLSTLAPALDGEPDPVWRASTRARLVAMAAVRTPEPAPVSPLRRLLTAREGRRGPWRTRLAAGMAGAAAAVTGLAAAVALSADARPGDALYGLKRGTEQAQLALAGDGRGTTSLGFASTRLAELDTLLDDDDADVGVVRGTLVTMDDQTTGGAAWLTRRAVERADDAPLDALDGWSAGQSAGLDELLPAIPEDARARAEESADLLVRIDERVDALRVALECPSGPATSGSDALGPVPGRCDSGIPAPPGGAGASRAPATEAPGAPGTDPAPGAPGTPGGGTGGAEAPRTGSGVESEDPGEAFPGPVLPTPVLPLPSLPLPAPSPPTPSPPGPSLPGPSPPAPGTGLLDPLGELLPGSGGTGEEPLPSAPGEDLLPCVPLPPLVAC